jgi:hypothetical protein
MLSCVRVISTYKPVDWFSWKLVWISNINWRWYQLKGTEIPFACRDCPKEEVSRGPARMYVLRKNNALFYKKVCTLQDYFSHFWMLPGSSLTLTPPAKKCCCGMCCYLKTCSVMFAVNIMKPLLSHYFCHFLMSRSSFYTLHKKHNLDR